MTSELNKFWVSSGNEHMVEEYQDQMGSAEWIELYRSKKVTMVQLRLSGSQGDKHLFHRIHQSVNIGLSSLTKEARRSAWLLMLGIRPDGDDFRTYKDLFSMFAKE